MQLTLRSGPKRGFAPDRTSRTEGKAIHASLRACVPGAPGHQQAQVEALTKEYSDVITEGGGKVGKTEYWGLKTVAFKIKKNRKAHYSLMNIDAPPAAVAEMERRMGLSPDVIRFITIRVEEHETEPSIQMRKSDRDERGATVIAAASAAIAAASAAATAAASAAAIGGGGGFAAVAAVAAASAATAKAATVRARPARAAPRATGDAVPRPPRDGDTAPPALREES